MMQLLAFDWMLFSLTLVALLLFGIEYAWLVRRMWMNKVEGQTAYMVVGGVTIALLISIPTFGLFSVVILFAYFAACGLPMVIEYVMRVHNERRKDLDTATAIAKEAINNEEPGNDGRSASR